MSGFEVVVLVVTLLVIVAIAVDVWLRPKPFDEEQGESVGVPSGRVLAALRRAVERARRL